MSSVSLWKYPFPLTVKEASQSLARLKALAQLNLSFCAQNCGRIFSESIHENPDHFSCRMRENKISPCFFEIKIFVYIFQRHQQYGNKSILNCAFSLVLERKISTRQSREELIRRGVLKEMPEQGDNTLPRI